MRRVASPKDRKYLESLNLKALQKSRPKGDQDPKEYYRGLQEEATKGPLFTDKVLDTVERLPNLPKPVSKWLGNMDDKELKQVDSQDLRLIIDWVQGSDDADIEGVSWADAMEAQQNWHEHLHDDKEVCGEYETHKVVFSTGGYEFVDLTTDHDLQVEGCKLKHCVGGDDYCEAVANNESRIISMRDSRNEPIITIEYVVDDKEVAQCYGYKNHPPAKKLNEPLVKFFEHMKWYDGVLLLKNYTIPEDKWRIIISNASMSVLRAVAKSLQTPPHALILTHDIAKSTSPSNYEYVSYSLVNNKNTPGVVITQIANSGSAYLRDNALRHPNLPTDYIHAVASSGTASDNVSILMNPNTPQHIILNAVPKRPQVIAQHSRSPGALRAVYDYVHETRGGKSPNTDFVNLALVENGSTPEDVLYKLCNTDTRATILMPLCKHQNVSERILRTVCTGTQHADVLAVVAKNERTPVDLLKSFAEDEDYEGSYVQRAALENPTYLKHKNASVLRRVASAIRVTVRED